MKTQVTGTVVDGGLQLDQTLDLPSNVRVHVTVELAETPDPDRIAAWEAMKKRNREHPIDFGGRHFTRDELHDRY